jgi:precorrin-6Y C5,15-methyltransferase (decarboxylating)
MARLTILGIGYKPIDERGRKALSSCQSILGSKRLVEVFERYPEHETFRNKVKRIDSVDKTMAFIHQSLRSGTGEIVLLGSGDPLFFGIGARAVRELGQEAVEIIPDLTSLQWAFALAKEPWDDALLISLHGGPDPEKRRKLKYSVRDLPRLIAANDTIGILTDRENDPPKIARLLIPEAASHPSLQLFVGERMGYEDQQITKGTPGEIAAMSFAHPNVVIVKKESRRATPFDPQSVDPQPPPAVPPPFGLEENEISHSRGLITKDEIRAISLHALRLPQEGVFWDVGAGSGAISVEAGRLCPKLRVFSIEKDGEQLGHIERNRAILAARNIFVVPGKAPSALSALPSPDRVFIGGSGGEMAKIISVVGERMTSGVVVVNAATLETFNEALLTLDAEGFSVRAAEISITRLKPLGDKRHFAAQNPIFVIVGEKRNAENVAGRVLS